MLDTDRENKQPCCGLELESAQQERRRKRYKFALVKWSDDIASTWGQNNPDYTVEYKNVLIEWWEGSHEVLCDDQPYKVLQGMLKLLKENEE